METHTNNCKRIYATLSPMDVSHAITDFVAKKEPDIAKRFCTMVRVKVDDIGIPVSATVEAFCE